MDDFAINGEILECDILDLSFLVVAQKHRQVHDLRFIQIQRHILNIDVSDALPRSSGPHRVLYHIQIEELALCDSLYLNV